MIESTELTDCLTALEEPSVNGRPLSAAAILDGDVLDSIAQRVLWLSTAMIDAANRGRENSSGVKVGGHQTSSASMVGIMTSLWFAELTNEDRVSVKPHASPVLHSINYLLGELDESYMPRLREKGGLQSYPSRAKDPDTVDFSTGSVGIGATAPLWAATSHRYVRDQFPQTPKSGRFISLLGDAELDGGAVWEAITDPAARQLGELLWIVDLNRQSRDRVIPDVQIERLQGMFAAADWQVLTCKWGRRMQQLFLQTGGPFGDLGLPRTVRRDQGPGRARHPAAAGHLQEDRPAQAHHHFRLHHQGSRPGHGGPPQYLVTTVARPRNARSEGPSSS